MRFRFRISLLEPFDQARLSGWATGFSVTLYAESDSRAGALCAVNDWFVQRGQDVTILATTPEQKGNPLGFRDEELLRIKESGIKVKTGFHQSEVQIESLEEICFD